MHGCSSLHPAGLAHVLDPLEEAVTSDVVTEIIALAELAQGTGQALDRLDATGIDDGLEDLAFYHVISPWKQHGMPPLLDTLRWLSAILVEHEEL